jgi:hypothetical protein
MGAARAPRYRGLPPAVFRCIKINALTHLGLCRIGGDNRIEIVFGRRNMLSSLDILLLGRYFNLPDCLITITYFPIMISILCFPTVAPEDKSTADAAVKSYCETLQRKIYYRALV